MSPCWGEHADFLGAAPFRKKATPSRSQLPLPARFQRRPNLTARCSMRACTFSKPARFMVKIACRRAWHRSESGLYCVRSGAPAVPLSSAERAQIAGRERIWRSRSHANDFHLSATIFTLEATAGDTTGTAAIGWQFGDLTFDAKVSGPINASGGEAQLRRPGWTAG